MLKESKSALNWAAFAAVSFIDISLTSNMKKQRAIQIKLLQMVRAGTMKDSDMSA